MALEEPEVGVDIQFGDQLALAVRPALGVNLRDPVHHQHGRGGKLRVAGPEKLAPGAGQQGLVIKICGGGEVHGVRLACVLHAAQ